MPSLKATGTLELSARLVVHPSQLQGVLEEEAGPRDPQRGFLKKLGRSEGWLWLPWAQLGSRCITILGPRLKAEHPSGMCCSHDRGQKCKSCWPTVDTSTHISLTRAHHTSKPNSDHAWAAEAPEGLHLAGHSDVTKHCPPSHQAPGIPAVGPSGSSCQV